MSELRELRQAIGLKQEAFAALLDVPMETLRTWDSGRRRLPPKILQRAKQVVTDWRRDTELLSLDQLARELGVHQRTLRAAARTGRLAVHFSSRSVFGRPIRLATRPAALAFMHTHYRQYAGQAPAPAPLPLVPDDYDERVRRVRGRLRLTQHAFAHRIGAANKAVIYQWESRKRTPSPVFWKRIEALASTHNGGGPQRRPLRPLLGRHIPGCG